MSFGKVLLFSCIVLVNMSFAALLPLEPSKCLGYRNAMTLSLKNLQIVEKDYVEYVFSNNPPVAYQSKSLEPLEGITLPVGNNSEENRASVCVINDYLDKHLPNIIRNVTRHITDNMLRHVNAFHGQFEVLDDGAAVPRRCHRNITASGPYEMKEMGLRIIYFTGQWLEGFMMTCDCT